jgi:hypothetical protein
MAYIESGSHNEAFNTQAPQEPTLPTDTNHRNRHYSIQRGHYERGVANRFRERTGYKPVVLDAEIEPNNRRARRVQQAEG